MAGKRWAAVAVAVAVTVAVVAALNVAPLKVATSVSRVLGTCVAHVALVVLGGATLRALGGVVGGGF